MGLVAWMAAAAGSVVADDDLVREELQREKSVGNNSSPPVTAWGDGHGPGPSSPARMSSWASRGSVPPATTASCGSTASARKQRAVLEKRWSSHTDVGK